MADKTRQMMCLLVLLAVALAGDLLSATIVGPPAHAVSAAAEDDKRSADQPSGFYSTTIEHLESVSNTFYWRVSALQNNYLKLPHDMAKAIGRLTDGRGLLAFFRMSGIVLIILSLGYGIEKLIRRLASSKQNWSQPIAPVEGLLRFWGALLKTLPDFLGILIYAASCFAIFLLVYGPENSGIRPVFLSSLAGVVCARLITALFKMLLSPGVDTLRLIPFDHQTATYVYHYMTYFAWVIVFSYTVVLLFRYGGMWGDSLILLIIACGSAVVLIAAVMVLQQRTGVAQRLRGCEGDACDGKSWFMDLFASSWHLLAIGYLLIVWLIWSARMIMLGPQMEVSFIVSLLIVPIYLAADSAANWVINAMIGSMQKQYQGKEGANESRTPENGAKAEDSMRRIIRRIARIGIIFTLLVWLLSLWGFEIPFARPLAGAAFEILLTLVLAYLVWRMINGFISRKIKESEPAVDGKEEEDEWGGAATEDRSHTLLPILRKFIASFLVVMVTLIVLSAMGVNIGPLLAGAGVAGLAIGFGAQKLVSDVLSGLFFLVDDAFRVGEYIEAGSVSGVVEAITLRNVMLRHHRGMLQIVPHSDLGPVTNFMRGGIVVKLNLQFPYDTNIEKVRKVIKKVGQQMLEDPKICDDFIKPLKSQGVREVGDSVMTIRVKFTAKPGAHFAIRREAFKRITEALEAEGIHYAHRKVIVEVAQPAAAHHAVPVMKESGSPKVDALPTPDDLTLQRAAAAAAESLLDKEKSKQGADAPKKSEAFG